MAMERVVFLMRKAEKEQLKVYCDAQGFAFGKWMRNTLLQSAGIKKVTEVAEPPEEVAAQDGELADKDLF
jgi:hypothetical protein